MKDMLGEVLQYSKVLDVLTMVFGILAACYRYLFGKARRLSPGTGLAFDYYENFLGPILGSTRTGAGPTEVLLWMPAATDLPSSRSRFDNMAARKDSPRTYDNQLVKTDKGGRTILIAEVAGKKVGLDLPRTLAFFDRLTELHTGWLLQQLGTKDAFKRRELRNFWETLFDRIRQGGFMETVRVFCGDPESAQTDACGDPDWSKMCDRVIPKPHFLLRLLGF